MVTASAVSEIFPSMNQVKVEKDEVNHVQSMMPLDWAGP
jgi:hypothetical protein